MGQWAVAFAMSLVVRDPEITGTMAVIDHVIRYPCIEHFFGFEGAAIFRRNG